MHAVARAVYSLVTEVKLFDELVLIREESTTQAL
jgi:hypothetical protein